MKNEHDIKNIIALITKGIASAFWKYSFDNPGDFYLGRANEQCIFDYTAEINWLCFNPSRVFGDSEDDLSYEDTMEVTRKTFSEYFSIPCVVIFPGVIERND